MDVNYQKGQRLFVEAGSETVEGVFHCMDAKHMRLTLKNCVLHPSGKVLDGMYHYYKNEVTRIRVLDPVTQPVTDKDSEASGNWNLMHKYQTVIHPGKPAGKVTVGDVVMNNVPGKNRKPRASRNHKLTLDEYDRATKRIQNNVLIERKGRFFMDAVENIKAESCIGVSFEGTALGRNNPVSLMCISTSQRAYIFDIQTMGKEAYEKGLKEILESDKIEKIIHNCRLVSDCLYHKHNITLNRVFDTQVADLIITKRIQGDFPKIVTSLSQCLASHLNLPENLLYQPKIRDGYIGIDFGKWRQRPLPYELQTAIVKNTVFLLDLKEKLLIKMLHNFYNGVDIFLNVVKNADQEVAQDHLAKAALVPKELLTLEEDSDAAQENEPMVIKNGMSNLKL